MKREYLEIGRLVNTHGVRGVFKMEPWCDTPKVAAGFRSVFLEEKDGSYKEMKVKNASVAAAFVLISLEGIDDVDRARLYKGRTLYAKREDIPLADGDYFIADLIELPVYDADSGKQYGTISYVDMNRKTPLYTIKTEKGDVLFPAIPEFVKEVDIDKGVFICPISGFFDEV